MIWLTYGVIIIVGFSAFVVVKARVIEGRREKMQERERARLGTVDTSARKPSVAGVA